ncbi:MAG TPA: TolC family protein [Candidatus Parabacteroides intestinipullorum]|uniref:TolC family protein n=1 Tax=Candidatus Parabacteroides intestinipullorum TaxID=2838723 RepID=A0A9D1X7Y5_9BACT|nr:TolC family protein [Candidatus Parabacteroides intestinipullorum]
MIRIRNRFFFILSIGVLSLATASAQRTFTLDECLEQALSNNVRMRNAENEIRMAEHDRKNAFTRYFPSVSASGGGFIANKGLMELNMGPDMSMSMMKDGVVGGVSATLPLFAGGQIVNGNKLAKVSEEVSRTRYRLSENEVRLTTENYYWQVVTLKEKLRTLEVVEARLDTLTRDVEAAVQAGVTTRNDLLQVQLRQNEIKSNRLNVENALALSRELLAQYMGMGLDSVDVAYAMEGRLPEEPAGLFLPPESALPRTGEYDLLRQNLEATRLQKKIAVGKNLPTVAIGGGYYYDDLLDVGMDFWVGFATVSVPLSGWWGGSHDIKKQKLQVKNAENQLNDQSEMLMIRMRQSWNDLNDAYKQVGIALTSIDQATENLRMQSDYYAAGTCTMSDLLDAQTLFQQSRDKYVEAYAQYEVKKREYLQATGR